MDRGIFREYDIRGIAGQQIGAGDARLIGLATGTHLAAQGCRRLSVGRDCRLSSGELAAALIAGLRAAGCDVTDIGVVPTPLLYFSIPQLGLDGGVMVTASHNPPEYNGFKICKGTASVHGAELQRLHVTIDQGAFSSGNGTLTPADVLPAYLQRVRGDIRLGRRLRVGVDAGNGTAGMVAVPLLEALGCEVHPLYCEMDGRFPNHEADPTVADNLVDLIALVRQRHLDLGLGFDGDGDRLGVVDERGQILYGDQLMIIFARDILRRRPGACFVAEVKCSQTLYDEIERLGGRAVMWKTGHALIKDKIRDEGAALAGEMSGHFFFADRYLGFDDATYAAGRLLEILAAGPGPLSSLLQGIPATVATPEIRIPCPDSTKFAVVARVAEALRAAHPVVDIDGVRVLMPGGWGLVRASNTQPVLVLRFEADSPQRLEAIRHDVEAVLARHLP